MKDNLLVAWEFVKMVFTHKRMKALYWSMAGMAVPVLGAILTDVLPNFGVKSGIIVFIGLVIAQITKHLNSK